MCLCFYLSIHLPPSRQISSVVVSLSVPLQSNIISSVFVALLSLSSANTVCLFLSPFCPSPVPTLSARLCLPSVPLRCQHCQPVFVSLLSLSSANTVSLSLSPFCPSPVPTLSVQSLSPFCPSPVPTLSAFLCLPSVPLQCQHCQPFFVSLLSLSSANTVSLSVTDIDYAVSLAARGI